MKRGANYMLHFIVNPCARSGLGKIVWEKIEQKLADEQVAYQMYFTQYKCHATKIAQEITSDGHQHTLVVLGGDGSINEVINGSAFPINNFIINGDFSNGINDWKVENGEPWGQHRDKTVA